MRKSIHVIIPIDANNFDKEFITLFPIIYNNSSIHISILGKNPKSIIPNIPKEVDSILTYETAGYNYSFGFNLLLKSLDKNYDSNELVVVGDSWSAFSLIQLFRYEVKSTEIDLQNAFFVVDIFYDKYKINIESQKIVYSILKRANAIKGKYEPYCPIVITTINNLVNMVSGLEENLFTEFSRLHLINQLKKVGLSEIRSLNPGLTLRRNNLIDPMIDRDLTYIKSYEEKTKDIIFVPNNYNVPWGETSKITKLAINELGQLVWDIKTVSVIDKLNREKETTGKKLKEEKQEKELELGKKILIIVPGIVKNIISTTPLIKKIYEKYGSVSILTNDKTLPAVDLLKSFMIKEIYDLDDLPSKKTGITKYDTVIKTSECFFSVPKITEQIVYEPLKEREFLTETNYSIIDRQLSTDIPDPYCNYNRDIEEDLRKIQDSITICASQFEQYGLTPLWEFYEIMASKFSNQMNVFLLGLIGEKIFLDKKEFMGRSGRIKFLENVSYLDSAAIIRGSSLCITTSRTNLSWISYGTKSRTILLTKNDDKIPNSNWITKINIGDGSGFEFITGKIWEKI
jgi:hypothetical protein